MSVETGNTPSYEKPLLVLQVNVLETIEGFQLILCGELDNLLEQKYHKHDG